MSLTGGLISGSGASIPYVNGRTYSNTVIVKQASDLANIDSTKNYMIDGAVDMGSQSIEVPEAGISISGLNGARDTAILYSSADNYTMFVSPSGGSSGNMVLESCTIDLTGSNSQVFDLDNNDNGGAIDITGVNFGISPLSTTLSMGELTSYRQLLMSGVGFLFIDDGLTFNGTWTGIAVTTSIAVGFPAATLFKRGSSFIVNNIRSDINFLSVQPSSVLFDFQEADISSKGGFSLTNVRTTATNAVPNISGSSEYARFKDCQGIRNTYVGAKWYLTSEATTTISATNTPVKIAGTTTTTISEWFEQTGNNQITYIGGQPIAVKTECRFAVSGTNNDQIKLSLWRWDDSASAFVMIGSKSGAITLNGGLLGSRAESIAFDIVDDVDEGDYYEVRIENTSAARNVSLLVDSSFFITERAS